MYGIELTKGQTAPLTLWAPQILKQNEVEKAVAATLQILDNSKFIIVYE